MEIRSIEKLLNAVKIRVDSLHEAEQRVAERIAPNFNLFDFFRGDENGLSLCLACLLNPRGTHGQGEKFLAAFIKHLPRLPGGTPDWLIGLPQSVQTEKATDRIERNNRRIDIAIEWRNGVVGIENKPWATDQDQQLADYARQLQASAEAKNAANNWLLIYLSDHEPDKSSLSEKQRERYRESGNYVEIDYRMLCAWLDECTKESKALVVRIFIEELAKYIRSSVMGELDNDVENEVVNLILADGNLEGAFLISQSFRSAQVRLLKKFFTQLRSGLSLCQYALFVPDENKLFVSSHGITWFAINGNIPDAKKYLCFQFYGTANRFQWGIKRKDDFANTPQNCSWEAINSLMEKCMERKGENSSWWPWLVDADLDEFDGIDIRAWSDSLKPWQAMMDGSLANAIIKLASKVYGDVFKNHKDLLR